MARNTNNELYLLPGFFFHPRCEDGLEKLTDKERLLLLEHQGNPCFYNEYLTQDQLLTNCYVNRIPTHRRPGTPFPGYGAVPEDLREVIDLKGE